MGIEQRQDIKLSSETTSPKGSLTLLGAQVIGPVLRYGLERVLSNGTEVEYEDGFENEYIEAIQDGYLPIIVGSHQSHSDGISVSLPARTLTGVANEKLPEDQRLKGFALVLASSLYSGHQGIIMKGFFDQVSPAIERRKLTPLLHTRHKDEQKYNMTTGFISQYKDLLDAIENGYAIAAFPEGTTTAGKTTHEEVLPDGTTKTVKNENGKQNGMQEFMPSSVRMLISAAKDAHRRALIIPVSITGGPTVHNPDTKLPTKKALGVGYGFGKDKLVHIYVSNPMKSDEGELGRLFQARNWNGLNQIVANRIAARLPEEERGRYAY